MTFQTTTTTYGNLQNGDRIFIQGYLFQISGLKVYPPSAGDNRDDKTKELYGDHTVQFTGHVVDPTSTIARTGYDGGAYGGAHKVPCTIVTRPICPRCGAQKPFDQSCLCADNNSQ